MRACLRDSAADELARNMTLLMGEVARRVEDQDVLVMLAADMEEDSVAVDVDQGSIAVAVDHDNSISITTGHEFSSEHTFNALSADNSDEAQVIRHLLPLTVLVNNRRGNWDQSLREQVCASITNSTPLPCSGRSAIVAPERQPVAELELYLQMNCRQNVPTLDDVFDWMARNPE